MAELTAATTERLKWLHDAATELSATKLKMTMRPDELLVLTSELLANREAQPVKNTVLLEHSGCGYGVQTDMITVKLNRGDVVVQIPGNIKKVINEKGHQSAVIYATPPAPAVPDELRNAYKAEGIAEVLKDAREYAPLTAEQWGTLVKNWHQTFVGLSGDANACRAAMLAQPVSHRYTLPEGFKLVPVEPTEEMLRAAYRESGVYSAKAYRAMLAAAPEGGNGA